MALALRLGRTLRELFATVSSEELTAWRAFDSLSPIGDWRHDLGHGVVAALIANVNRTQGAKPFRPIDFMPLHEPPAEPVQSLGAQIKSALMAAQAANARKKKEE